VSLAERLRRKTLSKEEQQKILRFEGARMGAWLRQEQITPDLDPEKYVVDITLI
jgi:hypothetical protein